MQRWMVGLGRWSFRGICSVVASMFGLVSFAQAVPIDLTDATPSVSGATTLHIEGIATLGSSYWADFEWNENRNVFQLSAYGEEEEPPAPEGYVLIEGGTFTMGSPEDEPHRWWGDQELQHEVTLTRDFYLSTTEVTQAQWVSVMGSNPSFFSGCDNCPVEKITWYDAVDYCNALSIQEGLTPVYEVDGAEVAWDPSAYGYRLPTEAEWEYACRAGTTTAFYNGPGINYGPGCYADPNLDEIAWYCENSSGAKAGKRTQEVGQKLPNAWGLYDMSGNDWEWCWDWFANYTEDPVTDPTGPESGSARVGRGGGYFHYVGDCRSAARLHPRPTYSDEGLGLRPAIWVP